MPPPARPVLGPGTTEATLAVPEIRDYLQINALLAQVLDAGARLVRLAGVEGQRLLVAGLAGPWQAVVEVEGDAGPEVAAGLNSPGLSVLVTGRAADGAGLGLRAGRLAVRGAAGDGLGYSQSGGTILACGAAGHRAGLDQSGGLLALLAASGRLCGERQRGGLLLFRCEPGPHLGVGRTGGRLARLDGPPFEPALPADESDREALLRAALGLEGWLPPGLLAGRAEPPR